MKYRIYERVTYEVHADSAQEALETFLDAPDTNPYFTEVTDRRVEDEDGEPQEVEDR